MTSEIFTENQNMNASMIGGEPSSASHCRQNMILQEKELQLEEQKNLVKELQKRIQKLEDIVMQQEQKDPPRNHPPPSAAAIKEEEKKEDKHMATPDKMSRIDSSPAVAYRSFSVSFEENLRQRARGESHGQDPRETAPSPSSSSNALTGSYAAKEEETSSSHLHGHHRQQHLSPIQESIPPKKLLLPTIIYEFIKIEILGEGQEHPKISTSVAQETDAIMQDFLRIPSKLETLIMFGTLICLDSYLYVLTYLPIKAAWGIFRLLSSLIPFNTTFLFHRRHFYHLLQITIILSVYLLVLQPISISFLYHWIRGQNMLKLYVLMGMVEVFDRLMCSFGQDALDSLYWNITSRPTHTRTCISLVVVFGYVAFHSAILFVHVATLNVAINSSDSTALLTVLISGNFAEIKSTVFKKYNKQNLFKILTSDICERFKLTLFLGIILFLNYTQGGVTRHVQKDYAQMWILVIIAEILCDWIKHCFITKFNFIQSNVYEDYALILAGDVTGIGHEGVNLDHTHAVVKRVGLAQIPMVCVMARFFREALRYYALNSEMCILWWNIGIELFCALFVTKVVLGIVIAWYSRKVLAMAPPLEEDGNGHHGEKNGLRTADGRKNHKQAVV